MAISYGAMSASRLLVAILAIWILFVMLMATHLLRRSSSEQGIENGDKSTDSIIARLNRATYELDSLRHQNQELRTLVTNLRQISAFNEPVKQTKTEDESVWKYSSELTALQNEIQELKHFLINSSNGSLAQSQTLKEQLFNMIYSIEILNARDRVYKRDRLLELQSRVQKAIYKMQNPSDCANARKLVCQLNKGCGFGCQLHHVTYCMIAALASDRTMILETKNWRYAPRTQIEQLSSAKSGWELVFAPISETCLDSAGAPRALWRQQREEEYQVLDLPIIDALHPSPAFVPLAVPSALHEQLVQLHSLPAAWFVGQIAAYLMRLSSNMQEYVSDFKKKLRFQGPIVGIQVRRTDKLGTEASLHKLSEYMSKAEQFFDRLDFQRLKKGIETRVERRVYLATDEISIWNEEITPWVNQGYTFIGDSSISKTAGLRSRYSISSLKNIILDIVLLSECDHLVCTFSSQVCRLAFELMQAKGTNGTKNVDFSHAYDSLDDIYYFGGQRPHNQVAILAHKPQNPDELELEVGDLIGISGNLWNGYSKGINRRTHANGIYPSFKAKDLVEKYPFKAIT